MIRLDYILGNLHGVGRYRQLYILVINMDLPIYTFFCIEVVFKQIVTKFLAIGLSDCLMLLGRSFQILAIPEGKNYWWFTPFTI